MGPTIAIVDTNFGDGTAPAFITEKLGGIYTKVSVSNFNNWDPQTLRQKFDVLHFAYLSPKSIDANWTKLLAFMVLGGGILFEDPANVEDMEPELGIISTQRHTPGKEPTIVVFDGGAPPALRAFAANKTPGQLNNTTVFQDGISGITGNCADGPYPFIGPMRGFGFGCLVNNHIIFADEENQPTENGLQPLLWLVSAPAEAVVALYGEEDTSVPASLDFGNGRIIIQGTDHGYHAGGGYGDFQDNHFCLLTNEIIWLSQATGELAENAVNRCVANSKARRDLIGGVE